MNSHEPGRRVRLDPNGGGGFRADREPGLAHLAVGLTAVFVFTSLTLGAPPVPIGAPALRTAVDFEMLVRSPNTDQLAAGLALLTWARLGWGLLVATTLLRVLAVVTARVTSEAAWARSFRTVSDVVTLPWVRRAADASLAGTMFLRVSSATFAADEMTVVPVVVRQSFTIGFGAPYRSHPAIGTLSNQGSPRTLPNWAPAMCCIRLRKATALARSPIGSTAPGRRTSRFTRLTSVASSRTAARSRTRVDLPGVATGDPCADA